MNMVMSLVHSVRVASKNTLFSCRTINVKVG
jgi:hypothetical protein